MRCVALSAAVLRRVGECALPDCATNTHTVVSQVSVLAFEGSRPLQVTFELSEPMPDQVYQARSGERSPSATATFGAPKSLHTSRTLPLSRVYAPLPRVYAA